MHRKELPKPVKKAYLKTPEIILYLMVKDWMLSPCDQENSKDLKKKK